MRIGDIINLQNLLKKITQIDKIAIVVFLLSLILRVFLLVISIHQIGLQNIPPICPDSVLYMNMARDLISGAGEYEQGFFIFGPGFAYYLAIFIRFFGENPLIIILINILQSSLICLFIYKLGLLITQSRPIAIIAGLLSAFSYTSIILSVVVLSDTVYFFVFLLGLLFYIKGLENEKWRYFLVAGFLTGAAILIRSIGQFWPLMMIVLAFLYLPVKGKDKKKTSRSRRRYILRVAVSITIALAIVSIWVVRNKIVHDIPTLAFTSSGGGANVASFTLERLEKRSVGEIREEWSQEYMMANNLKTLSLTDDFRLNLVKTRETLQKYPWEMFKTYIDLVWINVTDINYTHRALLPDYKSKMIAWEYKIKNNYLNYIPFCFAVIGLIILLLTRRYKAFTILAGTYFYYAVMVGFTRWQGSRLFFPGQVAWTILTAVTIYYPLQYVLHCRVWTNRREIPLLFKRLVVKIALLFRKAIYVPNSILKLQKKYYNLLLAAFASLLIIISALLIIPPTSKSPIYRAVEGPNNFTFADSIVLSQIRLEETDSKTQAILFDFYAKKEITEHYKIFLHLYSPDKSMMLNLDFEPIPAVNEWQPNIIITQRRALNIKAGKYGAIMGFFRGSERLGESCCFNVTIK